jgi:threonine dehydratase
MVILEQIKLAQQRLRGVAVRTPLVEYFPPASEKGIEGQLCFKPENLQPIGSFKLRGAYNKIASLTEQERQRGVISYSSGNHAQGVAYAARALGVKAVIVMPRNAPKIKVDSTAALGAEIVTVGPASTERLKKAEELASERIRHQAFMEFRALHYRRSEHVSTNAIALAFNRERPTEHDNSGHGGTDDGFAGGRNVCCV